MEKLSSVTSEQASTAINSDGELMSRLGNEYLRDATFEAQPFEHHLIRHSQTYGVHYSVSKNLRDHEKLPTPFTDLEQNHDPDSNDIGLLRCILQDSRPLHVSGEQDALPFSSMSALQDIFSNLDLPTSYFQISDGSLSTALAHIFYDATGRPCKLELIAHCLTKQGNWAMALSHRAKSNATTLFFSVDERVKSDTLTDDLRSLQDYSLHPMLIPCIVFSATFQMAVLRRHSIKVKVAKLEKALQRITAKPMSVIDSGYVLENSNDDAEDITHLFELLHSCRADQASTKGRYDFGNSYHQALTIGFRYSAQISADYPDGAFFKAHTELYHWTALIWQRLQSLNERDKDHVNRVDNLANMLYNLVQQRDMRLQSSIARAAQRDSQDMKFITVLGSVFLPASLVATILNVPQFQFAEGVSLFGAYLGITVPFIITVVIVCLTRPFWTRWKRRILLATLA